MPHKMSPQVLDIIYNKQLRLVVNYKQSQTCNFDLSLVSLDGNSMNKQFVGDDVTLEFVLFVNFCFDINLMFRYAV